jgi:hypothetical protein
MSRKPNVVQAGGGNGMNVLGGLLNTWARKKDIDYRWGRESELLQKQHDLGMERDTHRAMQNTIAAGAGSVISSHFDNILESTKNKNKLEQLGEEGNQDRLTSAQGHGQATEMERLKAGNEIGRMSDEALYRQQNEDQVSGNRIKLEREKGKTTRKNEKHRVQTGIQGMRDLTSGLAENYEDPSTGISPLVSNSGNLQNIGNSLKNHPYMKANPNLGNGNATGGAPLAPQTGGPVDPDSAGSATVTPAEVKKPRVPKIKKEA